MSNLDITSKLNVVIFVSRNKDNRNIPGFKERHMSFVTTKPMNHESLQNLFIDFVNNGVAGETSRFYHSINHRDNDKIVKELMKYLIDNPETNVALLESKIASIAAHKENAKTKRWLFDFDIDDDEVANNFVNDIMSYDPLIKVEKYKTPNGYAIITSHGFDTRGLLEKWPENVTLKRDSMICYNWYTKE